MGGGPPEFTPDSTRLALLGISTERALLFRLQDCHLLWFHFPKDSTKESLCNSLTVQHHGLVLPTTPDSKRMLAYKSPVWAGSLSLAATEEVEVSFLSWGYLDVSVHPVHFATL